MTIMETLKEGTALLILSGISTPALDASLLLEEVLGMDRTHLVLAYPDSIPNGARHRFKGFLKRRLAGECVAYILGRKEFRGMEFTVSPAVLVPRPDTETLVEAALRGCAALGQRLRLLDLCTGSGAVAIALKKEAPLLDVWASDLSPEALAIARINVERLLGGPTPAQTDAGLRCVHSDLFANIPERFHLITANPPYVSTAKIQTLAPEVQQEPRLALDGGVDGLDILRRIIAEAPEHLYSGGLLLLEADPRQMKELHRALETKGFKGIQTYKDLSGVERVIGGNIQ
jgi:release factor glutamine methyltransferase